MLRRLLILTILSMGVVWAASASPAQAQNAPLNRYYYYPYQYYPHNYWPSMSPHWPEQPGSPYMKPPAYMAYPAFKAPQWRYELLEPQKYYRGFHFWLDQF
jgi:hypothetical protein